MPILVIHGNASTLRAYAVRADPVKADPVRPRQFFKALGYNLRAAQRAALSCADMDSARSHHRRPLTLTGGPKVVQALRSRPRVAGLVPTKDCWHLQDGALRVPLLLGSWPFSNFGCPGPTRDEPGPRRRRGNGRRERGPACGVSNEKGGRAAGGVGSAPCTAGTRGEPVLRVGRLCVGNRLDTAPASDTRDTVRYTFDYLVQCAEPIAAGGKERPWSACGPRPRAGGRGLAGFVRK